MNHVKLKLAIATLVTLLVGAALGYWFAQRSPSERERADARGQTTGDRKVLYWHDPMVPNARFDKPGKSPFMDMQLVPVYADDAGDAAVRVSPTVVQNLGIRLGTVEKAALQSRLSAIGSVAFDESLTELVQARVDGYITRLHVKTQLERVKRGQPLADITAPAWLEAQQEYLALLDAKSDRVKSIREAARERLVVLGVPEATIRELESQRKVNAAATLVAPLDGVVTELAVREGSAFMAGAVLFRVNGLKSVWANAQVPEAQVSMIPMASSVVAHATAWPGATFKGRVIALLPDVDPQTRTLPVRIAIDNADFRLAPGMFLSLDFEGQAQQEQLVVPSEAVIMTGERNAVIAAHKGGGFDVADVTVGTEAGGKTAILSGLQEGQAIVLSGQFLIDSEASLRSTVSRLTAVAQTDSPQEPAGAGQASEGLLHLTEGTVKAITPEAVTIAHEGVPSLKWDAMTTSFKAPLKGLPPGLKVGDRISFSFAPAEEGNYQIDSIAILDATATPEPKP